MLTVLLINKSRYWTELYPTYAEALVAQERHRGPAFIFDPEQGLLVQQLQYAYDEGEE